MQKRRSPGKHLLAFQLLGYGAGLELIMLALYRWWDISWLLYPIIVTFVCLMAVAVLLAPRLFVAVFGAIGIGLICAAVLIGLPVILLINSDLEPNPVIVVVMGAWTVITVLVLALVYVKAEQYLLKRVGVKLGRHPKL